MLHECSTPAPRCWNESNSWPSSAAPWTSSPRAASAGLKTQGDRGHRCLTNSGPTQQLAPGSPGHSAHAGGPGRRCGRTTLDVRTGLATASSLLPDWSELTDEHARFGLPRSISACRNVFPVLTPLAVDPGHPFPFMSNLSTSLGVLLRPPDLRRATAFRPVVKVPEMPSRSGFPCPIPAPTLLSPQVGRRHLGGVTAGQVSSVKLQDVIRHNLENLFPGMVVVEVMPFRITRNAEVAVDDDEPSESVVRLGRAGVAAGGASMQSCASEYGPAGQTAATAPGPQCCCASSI